MPQPQLIGVDWGTSSFRAYLSDGGGQVMDRRASPMGILSVADGHFEAALAAELTPWRDAHGPLPIIMSGMIGSRQGWREAAYVRCPADIGDLAANLLAFECESLGRLAIVPGLTVEADGMPDVMRGEETQIVGAQIASELALSGRGDGHYVLPGTHSKWVRVDGGRITTFSTYMTGEVFAAMKDHTILGRLMSADGGDDTAAFVSGVRAGAAAGGPGALLHRLFAARTLGLFDRLPGGHIAGYLSGLVIGAELGDVSKATRTFTIIGSDALAARYETAAACLGIETRRAPADCVAAGHAAIARAAGLIGAA